MKSTMLGFQDNEQKDQKKKKKKENKWTKMLTYIKVPILQQNSAQ